MATICFKKPRWAGFGASILCCAPAARQLFPATKIGDRTLHSVPLARKSCRGLLPSRWSLRRRARRGLRIGRRCRCLLSDRGQPQRLAHFGFQLLANVQILLKELLGVLASLPNAVGFIAEP